MRDGDRVHREHHMVHQIKDLVWNRVAQEGRATYQKQWSHNPVPSVHDLHGEVVAEVALAVDVQGLESSLLILAEQPEESEEYDRADEHEAQHEIAEIDMNADHAFERDHFVQRGGAQVGDSETRHGEGQQRHLKKDHVHHAELKRWRENLPPVAIDIFWNTDNQIAQQEV